MRTRAKIADHLDEVPVTPVGRRMEKLMRHAVNARFSFQDFIDAQADFGKLLKTFCYGRITGRKLLCSSEARKLLKIQQQCLSYVADRHELWECLYYYYGRKGYADTETGRLRKVFFKAKGFKSGKGLSKVKALFGFYIFKDGSLTPTVMAVVPMRVFGIDLPAHLSLFLDPGGIHHNWDDGTLRRYYKYLGEITKGVSTSTELLYGDLD